MGILSLGFGLIVPHATSDNFFVFKSRTPKPVVLMPGSMAKTLKNYPLSAYHSTSRFE